jgi:hypothetical protein
MTAAMLIHPARFGFCSKVTNRKTTAYHVISTYRKFEISYSIATRLGFRLYTSGSR